MDANDAKTGELTPHAGPQACEITGLILAGGLGTRMGGVDKGLQGLNGHPLVWHALQRMRPQVGPLAGVLAGLSHCATPWLATAPCDSPCFPTDLVARLAQAAAESDAQIAMAATREADGSLQPQPVHSLLHASLRDSLAAFIAAGQRKVDRWTAQHRTVTVVFEDAQAFFNANTPADLERLHRRPPA